MCQPMAPALPVDRSGDFGRSPFFGQLSGKLPPATVCVSVGTEIKAQGVRGKLNLCWNSLLLQLTHRKLLSKAIAIDNDLRGTGHQSQSGESIGRDNSGLAACQRRRRH
jgi:hypothetical protein